VDQENFILLHTSLFSVKRVTQPLSTYDAAYTQFKLEGFEHHYHSSESVASLVHTH